MSSPDDLSRIVGIINRARTRRFPEIDELVWMIEQFEKTPDLKTEIVWFLLDLSRRGQPYSRSDVITAREKSRAECAALDAEIQRWTDRLGIPV